MMIILYANRYRNDDSTVPALNSLDIIMQCSKQIGWHAADDRTLITTIRDLRLDMDLQRMTCEHL